MKLTIIIFVFIIFAFSASGQIDNSFRDTTNYTILSIRQFKIPAFDSSYSPTIVTAKEIEIVEKLFFSAIDDYNMKMSKQIDSIFKDTKERSEMKNDLLIPISDKFYSKQLLPVINKKGEKEIYINCFSGKPSEDFWKTDLIQVMDGGNDYFNLTINIELGTFYNVMINGYG